MSHFSVDLRLLDLSHFFQIVELLIDQILAGFKMTFLASKVFFIFFLILNDFLFEVG